VSEHYKSKLSEIEAIDVIEAFDLPRNLANVCKYILRAGKKDSRERDLEKAIDYLWRERYGEWCPKFTSKPEAPGYFCGTGTPVIYCTAFCKGCGVYVK